MSTDHHAEPPEGHLDPEALSAAIDDEASAAELAHLEGCGACQREVAALRTVQAAVAVPPVVVPAVVREAAIAAALEAAELDPAHLGAGAGTVPPVPATATGTGGAGATASGVSALRARQRTRPRKDIAPWLGVAAVLLLLVLAVPLLVGGGGSDDESTASDTAASGEAGDVADDSAALAAPDRDFTDVGDLGALDPGADLRPVLEGALGTRSSTAPAPEAAASDKEGAEPFTTESEDLTDVADGTEPTQESDQDLQATSQRSSLAAAEACIEPVRAELGVLGPLVLAGTATVEDEPALLLGFEATDVERPTVLVVTVAVQGCRLVTFQSYARG